MKKIFVALFAFIFSVTTVYFLQSKNIETVNKVESAKTKIFYEPISDLRETIRNANVEGENKTEGFKPFFDSFDDAEGFDGWFITKNLKGMNEVWAIDLSREWANEKNEKLVWNAAVRTENEKDSLNEDDYFHSVSITANKSHLNFTTNKIRGIQYRFDGEFAEKFYQFGEGDKVLKGTLQKFVKGKKVAEFTSDFAYYEPKCLH
jgi:hypothetical protein